MSEPTSKFNDLSSETVTKLVSILVAIVVFAVVLVPIVNGLADGDGDGGEGGSGEGTNSFNMTMKDLYGESYPWTTASGGYISTESVPNLTITNPDFKQMPWETGQTTLDSNFNPAFWTAIENENNGRIGYQLDLMALRDYYESYSQVLIDAYDETFPNWSQNYYDGIFEVLPTYMLIMDVQGDNNSGYNSEYLSPIGVGSIIDQTVGAPILAYGFTDGITITGIEPNRTYSSAKLIFYYDERNHKSMMEYLSEYTWIDDNQESHQSGDDRGYSIGTILFLGESDTGYMPLSLTNKDYEHLPIENIEEYMTISVQGGAVTQTGILIDKLNVADTVLSDVLDGINSDTESVWISDTLYDYTGQNYLVPNHPEYTNILNGRLCYTSFTENKMNIDKVGVWFYREGGEYTGYVAFMNNDPSWLPWIIKNTVALTSPADEGGSIDSGSTGISGTAGTILKIIPVLVGVGVILAIVALFYDPRTLINKD